MPIKYIYTEEQLREAILQSKSYANVLRILNIPEHAGGTYATLKKNIKKYNIDISHFTGQGWSKSRTFSPKRPIEDYLSNKVGISSQHLKQRLIKDGIFVHKCYSCELKEWKNKPIPIELHHINGNNLDNSIENLMIICPNCHAQTENYCGKNMDKRKINKKEPKIRVKKTKLCICGSKINKLSKFCRPCSYLLSRKIARPTIETLINDIQSMSMCAIGKKYGVTDNAIRKWCKDYKIDYKSIKSHL